MKNLTGSVRSKPENGRIEARRINYHTEQPHLPLGDLAAGAFTRQAQTA